jgi:hypothetical protein
MSGNVYRCYNIVDMEALKSAAAKIESASARSFKLKTTIERPWWAPKLEQMTKKSRSTILRNQGLLSVPGWRNWQTQRTQNPPVLSTLGVRLPLPAPAKNPENKRLAGLALSMDGISSADAADFSPTFNERC